MSSPVELSVETPETIANWRPLVHWFMAIPHFIVLYVLSAVSGVVAFLSFFTVVFTREVPDGLFRAQVMVLRYQWRVSSYVSFLHDQYPAFAFDAVAEDPGDSPAVYAVERPTEPMSRLLPFIKWLLVIPHFVVLFVLGIVAAFAIFLAFFAVLFTGKFPPSIQNFVVGLYRWGARVTAYTYFLTDAYPPFTLE